MRHDVRSLSQRWPRGWAEAHRDAAGDVGTAVSTASESIRHGPWDVAAAAGNRAAEALRTLEEITKTFDVEAAGILETMRYRLYDLDTELRNALGSRRRRQWTVCVLLSESICRLDWWTTARQVVEAGADCIQLREKDLPDRVLVDRAQRLVDLARPAGCSIVINDRIDVAMACNADGVHLGQDDLCPIDARRQSGGSLLIGVSTHGQEEAAAAVAQGADVCGVGPIFAGRTRPELPAAGPRRIASFVANHPETPHLAIGGITLERLPELLSVGCRGIGVSRAVCAADDPGDVVRALRDQLESTRAITS